MRKRTLLVGGVAILLVAGLGVYVGRHTWTGRLPLAIGPSCTVRADGTATPETADGELKPVILDPDQMANAATIAAVGIRREMPARAVVVALATAFQESKLRNLPDGDRDSIGLFQQRPSTGWGTPEQISDPRYAAGEFYDALRKVRGWQEMRITDAAQRVQRSAHPEAYEKWSDESTVLAAALLGQASGAVACSLRDEPAVRGVAAAASLTESLSLDWGALKPIASAAAQSPGLSLAVTSDQTGWRYAHWLVSHAAERGIKRVLFGDQQWTGRDGEWKRVPTDAAATDGHVVAEVFADS